jgi:prolipoprotein diacylglyceryltransferase
LYKNKINRHNGYLFGVFFAVLFSVRFLVEFVKVSQGGFEIFAPILSTGQWLSIPMILFGLFFVFRKTELK